MSEEYTIDCVIYLTVQILPELNGIVQTAVVLPSVLHLHQQILFVVQLGYIHVFIIYVASGMSLQRVV